MEKIPYFQLGGNLHEQLTINQVLEYLKKFDENLRNDKIVHTVQSVKKTFNKYTVDDIRLLRKPGQGIIADGYLKSATLIDGFRAINRRGFYKIMGEATIADVPNTNGQVVKTLQAPILYTLGVDQQIYADFLNVGPLVNQYAYGFDFVDCMKPSLIPRFEDFEEKISFFKTLQDSVIYVLEQFTLMDDNFKSRYKYYPKHTVWIMFPNSAFIFVHNLQKRISGTERLNMPKENI